MSRRRREQPVKRLNPSGQTVWVARYTDPGGRRHSAGSYPRKREAQDAIDAAYETATRAAPRTVGDYAETWTERHPRSARTNATNSHRLSRVLDVELEGMRLRDWPFRDLRRPHAVDLVDHMLHDQGRAHTGAQNILRSLSAMSEDAITDEIAEVNFVRGVRVRANDPRVRGETRPARVFGFDELRRFAARGREHEPMLRVFRTAGCGWGRCSGSSAATSTARRSTCAAPRTLACSRRATSRRSGTCAPCRARLRRPG
jgi:hypothetical protein